MLDVGEPIPTAIIKNGELDLRGGSPRYYINGKYQNVEFSAEFMFNNHFTDQIYLSARSNHETRNPPGFGGYPFYIDISDKRIFFKKEQSHAVGYSKRLGGATFDELEIGKWYKAIVRITNIENGQVKLEGRVHPVGNEMLGAAFKHIDKGQITCGAQTRTPPFTGFGESCFFRLNSNQKNVMANAKFRNAMIKAI